MILGGVNLIKKKMLIVYITVITILILLLLSSDSFTRNNSTSFEASVSGVNNEDISEISNKLVRFHVIANSDSKEDQSVKLKVRDAILKDLGSPLEKIKTRSESLKYLKSKSSEIERLSDQILAENGENYKAKAMIGEFDFPIKSYGDITLPEGKYTAFRVVLGKGSGKNWWCVMFPPLCFIDITRGLTTEESDKSLNKVLNEKEIKEVTSGNNRTKGSKITSDVSKVEFRFKTIEIVKKLFKR